jgi:tetratricopeptide (TPR) repeat protein
MWFVIAISPISNTLFLSGVLLAERTLYLPSVGLSACVGWLFVRMARDRPRAAPAVLLVVLVAASVHSWQRNPVWRNNQTLFGSMLEDYPHSGRSQWLLADNFLERGQIPQALFAYAATVNLLDGDYAVLTHVAGKLSGMEMYEGAEGLLDFAIRDRPGVPVAYGQRAGIRAEYGDARGAERYARASLAMYPRDALRLDVLAWALASRDAWEEAQEARARAEAVGTIDFWHRSVYDAYLARRAGDTTAVREALDSAAVKVQTRVGSIALDSIRVDVFGLDPLLPPDSAGTVRASVPDGPTEPS